MKYYLTRDALSRGVVTIDTQTTPVSVSDKDSDRITVTFPDRLEIFHEGEWFIDINEARENAKERMARYVDTMRGRAAYVAAVARRI